MLAGSQNGLVFYAWPELKRLQALPTKLYHIHDIRFAPDQSMFAIAGGEAGETGEFEIWSWPASQLIVRTKLNEDLIYQIAWRSDGRQLATAGADGTVNLVEVPSGRLVAKLEGHSKGVTAVAYLPGGELLVSAGLDESIRIWNLPKRELIRSLTNHTGPVRDVAVSPIADRESPQIASIGADATIRLWQPLTGRLLRFAKLPAEPLEVEWTADGNRLVAACNDGNVRIFTAEELALIQDVPAIEGWAYALSVAPDQKDVLIAGSAGQIRRLNLAP